MDDGGEMHRLIAELFPICRSITGDGVRRTLGILGREAPIEVQYVKMWTRIPEPEKVIGRAGGNPLYMTYDPWELHLHQREEDTLECKTLRQGQLPNYLRERYGFEPLEDKVFRGIDERTWWDEKEAREKAQERRDASASAREEQIASDLAAVEREEGGGE